MDNPLVTSLINKSNFLLHLSVLGEHNLSEIYSVYSYLYWYLNNLFFYRMFMYRNQKEFNNFFRLVVVEGLFYC